MSTLFETAGLSAPNTDAPSSIASEGVARNGGQTSPEENLPPELLELSQMVRANHFNQLPASCFDDLAHRFLQSGVENGCLTHGFIFKGTETSKLYATALLLAKIFNCQQPPQAGTACGTCTHCRWVESNSHPAVMTLSRLSLWDDDTLKKIKDRKNKPLTKIVVSQVNELIRRLSMSSDYHRVVIVTDVELVTRDEEEVLTPLASHEMIENLNMLSGEHQVNFKTITRQVFDDSATNKLLKTLEEPNGHITFIFLAQQDDQLIDTIVSRCQVLPFAALGNSDGEYKTLSLSNADLESYVIEAVTKLEAGRHRGAITAEHFYVLLYERLMGEYGCTIAEVVQAMMVGVHCVFVRGALTAEPFQKERYEMGVCLLERLTDAERQLASHVNPDGVLSHLRYDLADLLSG